MELNCSRNALQRTVIALVALVTAPGAAADPAADITLPAAVLQDKIRGGLLGEILGNLNGLPHEMKYRRDPGDVRDYVPSLPHGAWSDDDTDFEWVYLVAMQQDNRILLSPERIAELWKQRINRRIWCANYFARQLMELGMQPPQTGDIAFNPWAEFNISGQFLCEAFGLIAPAMPQTAARTGLNYTRVAIDGEPAQTTQLFTSMIATAFVTADMDRILDAGTASVDPRSTVRRVVQDVRQWHQQYPDRWRQTRQLLKKKYAQEDGTVMRDMNGYELNTGSIIAALLYGQGGVVQTLTTAFNFGWDADCNAATAGTIVGVVRGYRSMMSQGWQIVDRYENRTRDNMPDDETITSYADRLMELAERVIVDGGGQRLWRDGRPVFVIRAETPANVYALADAKEHLARLKKQLGPTIERDLLDERSARTRARAAYQAICLGLASPLRQRHAAAWQRAVADLETFEPVVQAIYHFAQVPLGKDLQARATAAGLTRPAQAQRAW